jgi:hypothetical protein
MKTIFIFITLLLAVFSDNPSFGGFSLVTDEAENHFLHKALDSARPELDFAIHHDDSLFYIGAYQQVVNGVKFELFHAIRNNDKGDIQLIKTEVTVGLQENADVDVDFPRIYHSDTDITWGSQIDEFKTLIKELLGIQWSDWDAHVEITSAKAFILFFDTQDFYVVTAKVTHSSSNGNAVKIHQFVFSQSGFDWIIKKEVKFE